MSLRTAGAALLRSSASRYAANFVSCLVAPRRGTLLVLTYHRIDWPNPADSLYGGLISASPEEFLAQIRWLRDRFPLVSIVEVIEAKRRGLPLPPGAVLLTFDDAYRDFAEHAWPVLRRLEAPATVFVPTAYPDGGGRSFWWDRVWASLISAGRLPARLGVGDRMIAVGASHHVTYRRIVAALKTLPHHEMLAACDRLVAEMGDANPAPNPVLSWSDLRTLMADGVVMAPHSRTHPRLDRLPVAALDEEIGGSLADLRSALGSVAPVFAYPDGASSPAVVAAVQRAGFEMAFTTRRGGNILGESTPWYLLRRINVGERTNVSALAAQLALWSHLPGIPPVGYPGK